MGFLQIIFWEILIDFFINGKQRLTSFIKAYFKPMLTSSTKLKTATRAQSKNLKFLLC